ncbi:hypothetical protein CA85_52120 [Allorhodopirellula solitaria]|uniref:Uncharacterized protein n=1 Tax=Allorhodopirellula solitaria TaxID=2527987 RepID=A0A5C5WNI7_9BACT|nr:hypothetical protein CA85_52120 [Allorhodopirellula solitaria]
MKRGGVYPAVHIANFLVGEQKTETMAVAVLLPPESRRLASPTNSPELQQALMNGHDFSLQIAIPLITDFRRATNQLDWDRPAF